MYDKTVLDNGLRLITYAMPGMQSAAIGVWVRSGGRYESKQIKGIAHFLEHLVFKGSRQYSCRQIKELIEGVGGMLNGFTSEETTCYFSKLPAAKQFQALDILLDMVINPRLNPSDIERERFVILEEIKMHRDLPQSYVYDLLDQICWPGHPLGLPVIGEQEVILRLRRKDILSFQKGYYTPSNIVVAACGRVEHHKILGMIKAALGGFKVSVDNKFIAAGENEQRSKIKILRKDTAQVHLAMGYYGVNRDHPDKYVLSLLHVILGGNMSSRLFSQVREKRALAYEIGTQIKGFADTGMFLVRAGVDDAKMHEVIKVIIEELNKIKNRLVPESELRRAKEFYIGQINLALEDTLDHMLWIGEPTLHLDKTFSFSGILKKVKQITAYDLRRVARTIFNADLMRLAIIGPLKHKNEEEKLYACTRNL